MTIVRAPKPQNRYARICTQGLEDPRLSWKAKGILSYLLSRPDNWEPRLEHLKTISKDGRDSTATGLNELKELGYYQRLFHRDEETGRVVERENRVVECPASEVVSFIRPPNRRENPCSGKADTNNNLSSNQKLNTTNVVVESDLNNEPADSSPALDLMVVSERSAKAQPIEEDTSHRSGDKAGLSPELLQEVAQLLPCPVPAELRDLLAVTPLGSVRETLAEFRRQQTQIRGPIGWLIRALQHGYKSAEQERSTGKASPPGFKEWFEHWRSSGKLLGSMMEGDRLYVFTADGLKLAYDEAKTLFTFHFDESR